MARLTVEDCLQRLDNRYDLVILASKRARQLTLGSDPLVTLENIDKIGKYNPDDVDVEELGFPIEDRSAE